MITILEENRSISDAPRSNGSRETMHHRATFQLLGKNKPATLHVGGRQHGQWAGRQRV